MLATRSRDSQRTRKGAAPITIDDGAFTEPQTGKIVFSYAHPIFWAPFALIGDGN